MGTIKVGSRETTPAKFKGHAGHSVNTVGYFVVSHTESPTLSIINELFLLVCFLSALLGHKCRGAGGSCLFHQCGSLSPEHSKDLANT